MSYVRAPLAAMQAAVYDRVTTDHPTYSIFRYEPSSNPSMPYSFFGIAEGASDDTKTNRGCRITFPIEIFSQSNGVTELNGILNGFLQSLTNDALPLIIDDDWCLILVDAPWTAATEPGDAKGPIQHGTIRLSILVEDVS